MTTQTPVPQLSPQMRRITLILPLALAFLLTLFFYGLGGGHGNKDTAATQPGVQGINMTLPSPQAAKGTAPDKLGYYHQADIDSTRKAQQQKIDPYFIAKDTFRPINSTGIMTLSKTDAEHKADQLLQQLDEMKRALAIRQTAGSFQEPAWHDQPKLQNRFPETPMPPPPLSQFKTPAPRDPELDRIDGVLEKLIRVQHPDLVKPDNLARTEPPLVVTLNTDEGERQPGFMEITENAPRDSLHDNAIPAEISGNQTITTASSVELRLTRPITIEGHLIPPNQLVRGTATLNGERLSIVINSIRVGQSILAVALQAYDLDGIAGIRIPGAILRDVSKESADQAINSLATASVDPSLEAQAASAGLQFARSLATKKVRLIQVALPAGYQVLLKNVRH
jgi:hypothetical protein